MLHIFKQDETCVAMNLDNRHRYVDLLNDRRLHHDLKYTAVFSVFEFAQRGGFIQMLSFPQGLSLLRLGPSAVA